MKLINLNRKSRFAMVTVMLEPSCVSQTNHFHNFLFVGCPGHSKVGLGPRLPAFRQALSLKSGFTVSPGDQVTHSIQSGSGRPYRP